MAARQVPYGMGVSVFVMASGAIHGCATEKRCASFLQGNRVSARQPTYFPLLAHRIAGRSKVGKAKGTLLPASLRIRYGQPAGRACGGRRRTRCTPSSLRSDSCGEAVSEACASFAAHATSQAARLGAGRREWVEHQPMDA